MIIDETPGLRPCTGCWTHQNTPRPLRGPLQRTCGPRTARGAALETGESRGAAGAQKVCVGAEALRARSAALSKLIVRREQNNFAGGGTVAGLVPWAPVAARRAEVRTSGPNLVPPRSMWNKCFGRRKRTTIFCTGCWGLAKTPRGRSAALSGELGGRGTFRGTARGSVATPPVPAQCVRRPGRGGRRDGYFKRLAVVESAPN